MAEWGGYGAIIEEARELAERPEPLVSCPRCGARLDVNSEDIANCPLGHWREAVRDGTR